MISAFTELVKNRHDRLSESFILRNFHELFAKNLDLVTLNLILDPIVQAFSERIKGDRLNKVRAVSLASDEIYFLLQMSQHENLNKNSALQLLELLSTVYIGKPHQVILKPPRDTFMTVSFVM